MLLSILIFSRTAHSEIKSKIIWIVGLLFISGSYFWRFHVERGQIYILYTFLLSLAYWISLKTFKGSHFLSGFFVGITASLRPPVIFSIVPMFIYKKWKLFIGVIIGVLSGIGLSIATSGVDIWKSYFSAMKAIQEKGTSIEAFPGYPNKIIEGMDNLRKMAEAPFRYHVPSIPYAFKKALKIDIDLNQLSALLILTVLFAVYLLYKLRTKNISQSILFLVSIVLIFISEFFMPGRNAYANIIWLPLLSLIIINSELADFLSSPLIVLLIIGLSFGTYYSWMPFSIVISEISMFFYIVLSTLFLIKKNWRNEKSPAW